MWNLFLIHNVVCPRRHWPHVNGTPILGHAALSGTRRHWFYRRPSRRRYDNALARENTSAFAASERTKTLRHAKIFLLVVCEPVGSVSDEGGLGRARRCAARSPEAPRERGKPTEVGGGMNRANPDETLAGKGQREGQTTPHSGEGCGDTLRTQIFIEKGPSFVQ